VRSKKELWRFYSGTNAWMSTAKKFSKSPNSFKVRLRSSWISAARGCVRNGCARGMRNWLRALPIGRLALGFPRNFPGVTRKAGSCAGLDTDCHPHAYKVAYRDQVRRSRSVPGSSTNFLSGCDSSMFLMDVGGAFEFSVGGGPFRRPGNCCGSSPIATRMIHRQAALMGDGIASALSGGRERGHGR